MLGRLSSVVSLPREIAIWNGSGRTATIPLLLPLDRVMAVLIRAAETFQFLLCYVAFTREIVMRCHNCDGNSSLY